MNGSHSAIVSTRVIKSLDISADDVLSPEKIVKYCDEALQVIAADEELHRATRIFKTITNSVKRTLKIYLKKRKSMAFELPEELKDLDFKDEKHGDANWQKAWSTGWSRNGKPTGCISCVLLWLKTPFRPSSMRSPVSLSVSSLAQFSLRSKS